MARWAILFVALAALLPGCGGATPGSLTDKALEELRGGQYNDAIATCTEVIAQEPRNAEAYLYRGRAYHFRNAMGDPSRALGDFTKSIELAPESSDAYYYRAAVYRDLGQEKLADNDDRHARDHDRGLEQLHKSLPDLPVPRAEVPPPKPQPGATQTGAAPAAVDAKKKEEDLYTFGKPQGEISTTPRRNRRAEEREPSILERRYVAPAEPESRPTAPPVTALDPRNFPSLSPPGGSVSRDFNQRRIYRPVPTSPFQPPTQYVGPSYAGEQGYAPGTPGVQSPFQVRSPFQQQGRPPAANPFGGPANPFGAAPRGTQSSPSNGDPNSLVRPPNPRDYVP